MTIPRVLSIAGTDPTGGAGIQADLKSIGALGGYGMAVATVLVSQNTRGVRDIHVPPLSFLTSQLAAVRDDVDIDAVKLGMLYSADIIGVVRAWLEASPIPVVVLDPVMVATSGDRLLDPEAEAAIRDLVPLADLVTPNIPELAVLSGDEPATTFDDALAQAQGLARRTGTAVLVKGGHLEGADAFDAIVTADDVTTVSAARVETSNTHGTGCSLSSAMATLRATGLSWPAALRRAKTWMTGALIHADALHVGTGNGPIDHFHETRAAVPGGSWSTDVWAATEAVRRASHDSDFVRGLADGTLDRAAFEWYLAQDALYLAEFARAMALASAVAPTTDEQIFWSRQATDAIVVEAELHRTRVGDATVHAAPATSAYTNHLIATAMRGSYAEIVAAVLPCYWLYREIGRDLSAYRRDGHPYDDWLATYADDDFSAATDTAIGLADRAAENASPSLRERMTEAFGTSMQHELDFFNAPLPR